MRYLTFLLAILTLFGCAGNAVTPAPTIVFDRELVLTSGKLTFLYFSTPN